MAFCKILSIGQTIFAAADIAQITEIFQILRGLRGTGSGYFGFRKAAVLEYDNERDIYVLVL